MHVRVPYLDERVDVPLREAEHDDVGPGGEAGPLRLAGRRRRREAVVGRRLALVGRRGPQDAVLRVQARRQRRPSGHRVCGLGKGELQSGCSPERRSGGDVRLIPSPRPTTTIVKMRWMRLRLASANGTNRESAGNSMTPLWLPPLLYLVTRLVINAMLFFLPLFLHYCWMKTIVMDAGIAGSGRTIN